MVLKLALTGAPPNSEIFLFTDATAKDQHLRSTVIALIERTKSEVSDGACTAILAVEVLAVTGGSSPPIGLVLLHQELTGGLCQTPPPTR